MIAVVGAHVVAADRVVPHGSVLIDGGRVVGIEAGRIDSPGLEQVAHPGCYLVPGFVDVHVHGVDGHDVLDDSDAVASIAARLPRYGVTAFCPTTVACAPTALVSVLTQVARARHRPDLRGARVLRAHLERSEEHTSELQSH